MTGYYDWLDEGIRKGYVTVGCYTHGVDLTDAELAEYDEYDDPCVTVLKVNWDNINTEEPPGN
jgi:hypothetical protein